MRSPLPFLALTLLAQVSASNSASSRGIPQTNVMHASTEISMLALAGQVNKAYKYSAPDGSYAITFPGKPTENTQTVQTQVGPIKVVMEIYQATGGKRGYAVSSTQYKIDPRKYNVEKG